VDENESEGWIMNPPMEIGRIRSAVAYDDSLNVNEFKESLSYFLRIHNGYVLSTVRF